MTGLYLMCGLLAVGMIIILGMILAWAGRRGGSEPQLLDTSPPEPGRAWVKLGRAVTPQRLVTWRDAEWEKPFSEYLDNRKE